MCVFFALILRNIQFIVTSKRIIEKKGHLETFDNIHDYINDYMFKIANKCHTSLSENYLSKIKI